MKSFNKTKFVEELVEKAWMRGNMIGSPDSYVVQSAIRDGREIPERCKPGRLIMSLSDEDRRHIKTLKSSDFNHRGDALCL